MAEGLLRRLGGDQYEVSSAGTSPSHVNPLSIEVMREISVDLSSHRSKSVTEFEGQRFETVITVCDTAAEHCPVFLGAPRRIHWSVPDPAVVSGSHEEKIAAFRSTRNALEGRLRDFLASEMHSRES